MATPFMDKPGKLVTDALEGMIMCNPHLQLLDGFASDIKVVLRRDWDPACGQVAILSGGGSGHEPSHGGFVASGMLTGAVCGDIFASPSIAAVSAAIHAVAGMAPPGAGQAVPGASDAPSLPSASPGVLLIVKNYGGDRLNFGLAATRATAGGIPVEVVTVADDCALQGAGPTGRRGIAGTVLVHKAAGAAAAAGGDLATVAAAARRVAAAVATMGVASSTCTIPGRPRDSRLDVEGAFEVGLGIHGEPGREVVTGLTSAAAAETCIDSILQRKEADGPAWGEAAAAGVAVLVNNLGGATPLELYAFARNVHETLAARGLPIVRLFAGALMTALDMRGVSVSLLPVDEELVTLLDAETASPFWPAAAATQHSPAGTQVKAPMLAAPVQDVPRAPLSSSTARLCALLQGACMCAEEAAGGIDALDAAVADGDAGSTLRKGAAAVGVLIASVTGADAPCCSTAVLPADAAAHIEAAMAPAACASPAALLAAVSECLATYMGGTLGVLFALGVSAAQASLHGSDVGVSSGLAAFQAAVAAVVKHGGASPGMATMVDALVPAGEAGASLLAAAGGAPVPGAKEVLAAMAAAAQAGADGTAGMTIAVGRGAYAAEAAHAAVTSTVDAGAQAVAVLLGGAAAVASSDSGSAEGTLR